MVHKKDLVTRLKDIWDKEIEIRNQSFIDLFKSHTELLEDILDLKILPSEPDRKSVV